MKKITAIVFALLIGFGCTANASCPKFKNHKKGDEITPFFIAIGNKEKTVKIKGKKYEIVLSKKLKKKVRRNHYDGISTQEYKALPKKERKDLNSAIGRAMKDSGSKIKYIRTKRKEHFYEAKERGKTRKFSLKEKNKTYNQM